MEQENMFALIDLYYYEVYNKRPFVGRRGKIEWGNTI